MQAHFPCVTSLPPHPTPLALPLCCCGTVRTHSTSPNPLAYLHFTTIFLCLFAKFSIIFQNTLAVKRYFDSIERWRIYIYIDICYDFLFIWYQCSFFYFYYFFFSVFLEFLNNIFLNYPAYYIFFKFPQQFNLFYYNIFNYLILYKYEISSLQLNLCIFKCTYLSLLSKNIPCNFYKFSIYNP